MRKIIIMVLVMTMFGVCAHATSEVWELKNFVDLFGDETSEQYITNIYGFDGTYENTAVSNKYLSARVIVSAKVISFILHKNGNYKVKPASYENYIMRIKNESNGVAEIKVKSGYDRISIADEDSVRVFGKYIGAGEPIKILIGQIKYGIDTYLFEIPDPAPKEFLALFNTITD